MKRILNYNEKFEIVGGLYYEDTGYLRPGKSDPIRDTGSHENRARFESWLNTNLLDAALRRIAALEDELAALR